MDILQMLSNQDSKWRKIAIRITNDKSQADEIVQEMYLKLCNCNKDINDFYVTLTMRSIYLDTFKQKKALRLDEVKEIAGKETFELCDLSKEVIDEMKWWERELIEISSDLSYRDIQKEYNIPYGMVFRTIDKYRKLWQEKNQSELKMADLATHSKQ